MKRFYMDESGESSFSPKSIYKHFIITILSVETKIYGDALEKDADVSMEIIGGDSEVIYGIKAVDFFSWSIYRKFERGNKNIIRVSE